VKGCIRRSGAREEENLITLVAEDGQEFKISPEAAYRLFCASMVEGTSKDHPADPLVNQLKPYLAGYHGSIRYLSTYSKIYPRYQLDICEILSYN
jgi:hypothetical protein